MKVHLSAYARRKSLNFSRERPIDPSCNLFLTLNPDIADVSYYDKTLTLCLKLFLDSYN